MTLADISFLQHCQASFLMNSSEKTELIQRHIIVFH